MSNPVPLRALVGGVGIALASHNLLLLNGSVFGISGFIHRCYHGAAEPIFSVGGLILGGVAIGALRSTAPPQILPSVNNLAIIAASGFLVGLGTKVSLISRKMSLAWTVLTRSRPGSYPTAALLGELSLLSGCEMELMTRQTHGLRAVAFFTQVLNPVNLYPCRDLSAAPYRSIAATLIFMVTGSVTATIFHGDSASPTGALDWSLGDFASTYAIAQILLFLTSLYLHKAVSVNCPVDRPRLKRIHRPQNLKRTPTVTSQIYRPTGALPRF